MKHSALMFAAVLGFSVPAGGWAQDGGVTETWRLEGFNVPESATHDASSDVIYVSNVAGDFGEKDGVGFISRVSPEGEMIEAEWVTGLNAPKGLAIDGSTLYVADLDRLVAIDIDAGAISDEWTGEEGAFFNDVRVDGQGRVLVTDTLGNRIYVLEGGSFEVWFEDEKLHHPNGLALDGDTVMIAAWGQDIQPDYSTKVPGELIAVDPAAGSVALFGSGEPNGNLDGIEPDGEGGWLVTELMKGGLFRVSADGVEQLTELPQGAADLAFIPERSLVVVPLSADGALLALKLD